VAIDVQAVYIYVKYTKMESGLSYAYNVDEYANNTKR